MGRPRTFPPKSSTAIWAASSEPGPMMSLYMPAISVRTPILTGCWSSSARLGGASGPPRRSHTQNAAENRIAFLVTRLPFVPALCVGRLNFHCLDDLAIFEFCDLPRRQAEQSGVDFSVVLTQAGGGIRVSLVRPAQLYRKTRADHVSRFCWMAKRLQHVAL